MKMSVQDLTDHDLLEQFERMVKFWHYDPMGGERPSRFDVEELREEVLRRMRSSDPQD